MGVGGWVGTSIMYLSVCNKFHLKMTVLNSWINLAQKGYFGTKKLKIQINLDSTNKLDFLNKFQKIYIVPVENTKK